MSDLGQTAYEARFVHEDVRAWAELPAEARAVWARVERATHGLRQPLPQRRLGLRFDLPHRTGEFNVVVGLQQDGRPAEIFVSVHRRIGQEMSSLARDAAVIISLALQHGCSLESIAGAITREPDGTPSGVAGAIVDAAIERMKPEGGDHG